MLLAGLGVLAAASHQLIARALALAGANVLAPLQYLELISALSLGWLIWGTVPDPQTWVGALITVSSGVLVFRGARVV